LGALAAVFTAFAFLAAFMMDHQEWSTVIVLGVLSPIMALGAVVRAFLFFRSKNWLFGILASLAALVAAPLALLAVSNLVEAIAHPATITKISNAPTRKGQAEQPGETGDAASLLKRLTALIDRGDALRAQGQFADAIKTYGQSFDLASRLAKRQPNDTNWQLELSIINNRVGDVLRDQGQLAGALKSYVESVAIGERLVKQSQNNVRWQSELASSYERVGDISQQQKQWGEAASGFALALEIVRPWMAKPNLEASSISTFSYCAMSRWKVLLVAPKGTVTIDRAEALADLHTARDAMGKARNTGGGAQSSDENLPFVEEFLSAEEAREPGKK
jgi:tetratricopeptide (TPR) repeat protein